MARRRAAELSVASSVHAAASTINAAPAAVRNSGAPEGPAAGAADHDEADSFNWRARVRTDAVHDVT